MPTKNMLRKIAIIVLFLALFTIQGGAANAGFLSLSTENAKVSTVKDRVKSILAIGMFSNAQSGNTRGNADSIADIIRQYEVRRTYRVQASAYTSEVWQTDDSPFITASNTHVRDGVIAANFLPFGTLVRIPDMYGDKIFVVEDRMNKRYWHNIDIWMEDIEDAYKFGRRTVTIEVL